MTHQWYENELVAHNRRLEGWLFDKPESVTKRWVASNEREEVELIARPGSWVVCVAEYNDQRGDWLLKKKWKFTDEAKAVAEVERLLKLMR
jgi:hypothetical protein